MTQINFFLGPPAGVIKFQDSQDLDRIEGTLLKFTLISCVNFSPSKYVSSIL